MEVLRAQQKLLVKVRQGKANYFVQTSRKEVVKGENHVIVGLFPNGQKIKDPGGCRFGEKCAYKHTATPAEARRNSASIAIHIPSNDERQMQLRKVQSDDKTRY